MSSLLRQSLQLIVATWIIIIIIDILLMFKFVIHFHFHFPMWIAFNTELIFFIFGVIVDVDNHNM